MKYNYYNHKTLSQQKLKTLFYFSLYLLFVLFACRCYQPHKERDRNILAISSVSVPRVTSPEESSLQAHSSQESSLRAPSLNSVIAVTNPLRYIGLVICYAVGWYILFHGLHTTRWVQAFPQRLVKTLDQTHHIKNIRKLANRIISSLHATLISLAAYYFIIKKIDIGDWRRCLFVSMGYFLADAFITCQNFNRKEDIPMLVHHLVVVLCTCTAFIGGERYKPYLNGIPPAELLAKGFQCEITIPFLYACWYLSLTHPTSYVFIILSGVSLCIYFRFRVVRFTQIGYIFYQNSAHAIWPFFLSIPLTLLNYYWFIKLVKKAFGSKKNGGGGVTTYGDSSIAVKYIICWVILSFVGWHLLFALLCTTTWLDYFPHGQRKNLANNIVSSLHAIFMFSIAAYCYFTKQANTKYWHICLCISIGYFLLDTFLIYKTGNWQWADFFMLVHHVTIIVCICTAFVGKKIYKLYLKTGSPSSLLARGFLCEITMPFLYACWYLIHMQQKNSLGFTLLSIVSFISYFVFRVMNFTYIGYTFFQNLEQSIWPLALSMPLILLNYYWFIDLCKRAVKVFYDIKQDQKAPIVKHE